MASRLRRSRGVEAGYAGLGEASGRCSAPVPLTNGAALCQHAPILKLQNRHCTGDRVGVGPQTSGTLQA